jgi:Glutamate synthase domain 1
MCRLALKTANTPFSPYEVLQAMEAMQEGYDGSGLGLLLRGVQFEEFKLKPEHVVLSGIAHTEAAFHRLADWMGAQGFKVKYAHEFDRRPELLEDVGERYHYLVRVYGMPVSWSSLNADEIDDRLLQVRLAIRKNGDEHGGDLTVFSLYRDVVMLKDVGWPLAVGQALGLQDNRIRARVVMAQGRQNTNYGINLYACHPFFIQGIATMANGENTAFVPIKEWLLGTNIPGYLGYHSDSEVFTHILHYTLKKLQLPLDFYKHIITPLNPEELKLHPNGEFLRGLRATCRRLIVDGPNAVIATLPDETCMLTMDAKKMRPAVVGGRPGVWAMASEMCGIEALVPDRNPACDFQPMREHTVIISPERKEPTVWSQFDPCSLPLAA